MQEHLPITMPRLCVPARLTGYSADILKIMVITATKSIPPAMPFSPTLYAQILTTYTTLLLQNCQAPPKPYIFPPLTGKTISNITSWRSSVSGRDLTLGATDAVPYHSQCPLCGENRHNHGQQQPTPAGLLSNSMARNQQTACTAIGQQMHPKALPTTALQLLKEQQAPITTQKCFRATTDR